MAATGLPALLEEPIWYEPLRQPSWLLPPLREGVPRILFVPGEGGRGDDLRLGLPLFLGEAIRFSTDARVDVASGDWVVTAGSAGIVTVRLGPGGEHRVTVDVSDGSGSIVEELHIDAEDDDELGTGLAALPPRLAAALRPLGVRAVWSTVFQAPSAGTALAYARTHGVLARLRELSGQVDGDDHLQRVAHVRDALAGFPQRISAQARPLGVAAFIAALAIAKDAGSPALGAFRLQANAIAQAATDPLDPVYRLSIVSLTLFGDTGEASARTQRLIRDGGDDLRSWLARVRAIG